MSINQQDVNAQIANKLGSGSEAALATPVATPALSQNAGWHEDTINEGILSTIGNTPLVRLKRLLQDSQFELYAKLEAFNPGGSVKDRAAIKILEHALEKGDIKPGGTIVESSSGNMGIGLAQACAYLGIRLLCVVDPKTTSQNIEIMKAYGAEIDLVREPHPLTGEYLHARIERVKELVASMKNAFWPDQYANLNNPRAHHRTMSEVVSALGGEVDYFFCATSTCGTVRGCAEYCREKKLATKIVAVDAVGSVIFGGEPAKRLIPGHGAAVRPNLYEPWIGERVVKVTDLDCVVGCRRLVKWEAILAGGSSGAVLTAVDSMKHEIPRGAVCVALLADRGERYLDTIYRDSWVHEHFGDVSHLWQEQ